MTIHSKLYQKYVLINLCFILLPIALFLALYIHTTDQQVSKDLRASNEYALRQTMRTVDASADTLDTFAYRLGTSNQISPYFLQRGNYSTIEALNQLEMYTSQFGFLENLYLRRRWRLHALFWKGHHLVWHVVRAARLYSAAGLSSGRRVGREGSLVSFPGGGNFHIAGGKLSVAQRAWRTLLFADQSLEIHFFCANRQRYRRCQPKILSGTFE